MRPSRDASWKRSGSTSLNASNGVSQWSCQSASNDSTPLAAGVTTAGRRCTECISFWRFVSGGGSAASSAAARFGFVVPAEGVRIRVRAGKAGCSAATSGAAGTPLCRFCCLTRAALPPTRGGGAATGAGATKVNVGVESV